MSSHRLAAPRRVTAVALLASLLLPVAACTGPAAPARWHTPAATASPTTATAAAAQSLTLAFAGDVHFTGRTLPLLDRPDTAFGRYAEQMRAADFTMINLETAVTDRGRPEPKTYHFRAPVSAYAALTSAGVDLVSLANNHALDYGRVGLLDTLDSARDAGMPVVGAGKNIAEAYAPHVTAVHGVRLAVVAFSQVHELKEQWRATAERPGVALTFDRARATAAVRQARATADVVVVYLHWGTEGQACPNGEQRAFAADMAQAGADVVVGTHAHTLLGDGYLGDAYVHFGLGNYLWYSTSRSTDTGLLTVTVAARPDGWRAIKRSFTAGVVGPDGRPTPVSGQALHAVRTRLDLADRCARLADQPGR